MRKQYHFRPSKNGYYAWDVDKLVESSKDFPVILVNLSEIKELDENFWYGGKDDIPTCRSIVEHMQLVNETSLQYPIILSEEGRVMDGMHRVLKAVLNKEESIKAVKFNKTPKPDYEDVYPNELSYDED